MKSIALSLILATSLLASGNSEILEKTLSEPQESKTVLTDDELTNRVIYTNLIGAGFVTLWGVAFWDYFTISPQFHNEGWFEEDTKYGGADKMGHMYSTYLWSLGFGSLYEYWGMEQSEAAIYGSLTSWTFQAIMEVGDSFSASQGFSYEDMIANTVGALFYMVREHYPSLKEKIDMRAEFAPNFDPGVDPFTQYNSMKYLLALKFNGFDSMKHNVMKYGELHLGYYTRGYQNVDAYERKERIIYAAIGINLSQIVGETGWEKTAKTFNYIQLPYTYVPVGYDFNSEESVAPYSRPYFGTRK